MRIVLLLRSNFLFLCLLGLAFVLDQFGFDRSSSLVVAGFPALLSAIGGIASSIGNIFGQKEANEQNLEQNRQNQMFMAGENAMNRNWQEKMWNLQNQYNTPSALKQRLKEAGWNPFLTPDSVGTGSNAGAVGTPAMSSAPSRIPVQPLNYAGFGAGVSSAVGQYIQMKSVDANVANQQSETNRNIVETGKEIYRVLGKDAAQKYLEINLAPVNGSVEGSNFARQTVAQTAYDEAKAFRQELDNEIENAVGRQRASAVVENMRKNTDYFQAQIDRLSKLNQVSDQEIEEISSNILRNIAQAFNLQKQGEYYEVSSKQLSLINQSLSMDLKEQTARFNFGSAIRGYMNDKSNASRNFSLWQNQFEAAEITNEMESSRVVRYGERIIDNVSKGLKVNFGFNSSKSSFKGQMDSRSYNNNWNWRDSGTPTHVTGFGF